MSLRLYSVGAAMWAVLAFSTMLLPLVAAGCLTLVPTAAAYFWRSRRATLPTSATASRA
ncbi:MAG: hypothetical protein ACN6PR_08520 [Achromobacter sp.]